MDTTELDRECSITLPKITDEMVEDFYPWLINDSGEGYSWNQVAVDFACLLKIHCIALKKGE